MRIRGFTPVIDSIKAEVGTNPATTYGAMWRYAQQHPLRICCASQKKIADRAGFHRDTIIEHQKILAEASYIHEAGRATGGIISWSCNVDITGEITLGAEFREDDHVEDSDTPLSENPTPQEQDSSEKKDILDFVLDYSGKGSDLDINWMPVDVKEFLIPFAQWFKRIYDREATKSERGFWIREAREWYERGYLPENVPSAIEHCMNNDTTISSPRSLTWAFDQLRQSEDTETFSREM